MGGPRFVVGLVALAWLVGACVDQSTDIPTTPSFAKPVRNGCDALAVNSLVKDEFGASSSESGLATDMKNYGPQTAQGTYVGYQLLEAVAARYTIPANHNGSLTTGSQLVVELLNCMEVGGASIPDSFVDYLGPTGALGVGGWPGDNSPITSHDGQWLLEPPQGQNWTGIVPALAGLPDSVNKLFLAFGKPVPSTGFTNDQLVGNVFDWNSIPTITFIGPGVVVGECELESNYLQHNAAGNGPEVLGFVAPSCAVFAAGQEREPRTFAERLIRLLGPKPLFAALGTTTGTGGSKQNLSPFGLIDPSLVNLDARFQWRKSGNTVGEPFNPTPKYQIRSQAGTVFQQDFVLIWLEALGNSGTNVQICNNWAYTNADGLAQFPQAFLNKSGGYTIVAQTTGTVSKPDVVEGGEAPAVPAGSSVASPLVNVKNATLTSCPNVYSPGDSLPTPPGPNGFAAVQ